MNEAVAILDQVEAGAVALNGEVVRRALRGHCCAFFRRQAEFASRLAQYIHHRLAIHRLRVRERRDYHSANARHVANLIQHTLSAKRGRRELKDLWPCSQCIETYNPTGRITQLPQLGRRLQRNWR